MVWDDDQTWRNDPVVRRGFELVGAAVKRRRLRRGLTQNDLERLTVIHQSTISRIETGRRFGLRWSRFALLVAVLGGLDFEASVSGVRPGMYDQPATPNRYLQRLATVADKPLDSAITG